MPKSKIRPAARIACAPTIYASHSIRRSGLTCSRRLHLDKKGWIFTFGAGNFCIGTCAQARSALSNARGGFNASEGFLFDAPWLTPCDRKRSLRPQKKRVRGRFLPI